MTNIKIVEILEKFGITNKKASEIMGMSQGAFAMKKAQKNCNRFKEENLRALIDYIKKESSDLRM